MRVERDGPQDRQPLGGDVQTVSPEPLSGVHHVA
jgi:hypothetical protein